MSIDTAEYVYTLAAHQDIACEVWRRIANRPLKIVSQAANIPDEAIVLCVKHAEVPSEFIYRFHVGHCKVLWIERFV